MFAKEHPDRNQIAVFFPLPRLKFPFVLSQHGVIDTNGHFIGNPDLSDKIVNFNLTFFDLNFHFVDGEKVSETITTR